MFNKDFSEFVSLLNAHGVEYLVVGGYALAAHGHPRFTGDLDIWLQQSKANASRVLDALRAFGFGSLDISVSDLLKPDGVDKKATGRLKDLADLESLNQRTGDKSQ